MSPLYNIFRVKNSDFETNPAVVDPGLAIGGGPIGGEVPTSNAGAFWHKRV